MSRIDDLIADHCPEGVEFKPLGQLGRRNSGTSMTAARMKTLHGSGRPIRVFAGGQTIADVNEADIPAKDIIRKPSIIVKSRGHIGFVLYEQPFTHKSELWSYTIDSQGVDQRFVYYYLLTKVDSLQERARATSVKLPQLGVRDTDTLPIPMPPMEVQREIVRILDTFSALEAELEAELEARRIQYAHYRDHLFNAHRHIQATRLKDAAVVRRGTAITEKQAMPGDVPVVANGPISTYSHNQFNRSGETVVVARSGAYAGLVSYWNQPIFLTDAFSVHPDETRLTPKFVYYFLQSKQAQLHSMKKGAGVPHVRVKEMEMYEIPIPALAEQRRIVGILDNFDALVNDLSVGLPAELAARRTQYEHYRDRLLTFEERV